MTAMINDTNYAHYIKERENFDIIESDHSFIIYKIRLAVEAVQSNECFISHAFTDAQFRQSHEMSNLLNELKDIAFQNGCDRITATIDLRDKNASTTLLASLKYGFKVILAENGIIVIQKALITKCAEEMQNGNG